MKKKKEEAPPSAGLLLLRGLFEEGRSCKARGAAPLVFFAWSYYNGQPPPNC